MRQISILDIQRITMLLALLLSGCEGGIGNWFGTKPPYPVQQSTLAYATRFEADPIYWLDKDRVLIPGYALLASDDGKKSDDQSKKYSQRGLYILDTRTNTVTRHADLAQNYFLCYNDGFVTYTLHTEQERKNWVQAEGQFGQETPQPAGSRSNGDSHQSSYAQCPLVDWSMQLRPEHQDSQKNRVYALRPQDGYISVGPYTGNFRLQSPDVNVQLYRSGQSEPVELPILAKEMHYSVEVTYSDYAEKYLILPHTWRSRDLNNSVNSWPHGTPMPIYLVSPSGKTETMEIPHGAWQPDAVFLTQRGLFWVSNYAPSTNSGRAGGWLLAEGRVVKLFDHLVDAAGVSPDGCKIAYANNDHNPKTTAYVRIIELCK